MLFVYVRSQQGDSHDITIEMDASISVDAIFSRTPPWYNGEVREKLQTLAWNTHNFHFSRGPRLITEQTHCSLLNKLPLWHEELLYNVLLLCFYTMIPTPTPTYECFLSTRPKDFWVILWLSCTRAWAALWSWQWSRRQASLFSGKKVGVNMKARRRAASHSHKSPIH